MLESDTTKGNRKRKPEVIFISCIVIESYFGLQEYQSDVVRIIGLELSSNDFTTESDVGDEDHITGSKRDEPKVIVPVEHNLFDRMFILVNCF